MRTIIVGLAGLSLALAASSVLAQGGPTQNAAAPTSPMSVSRASVEKTTIGKLVADPRTRAVLAKELPGLLSYRGLNKIKGMTLRGIARFPQADLSAAKLAEIQRGFDAIPAT